MDARGLLLFALLAASSALKCPDTKWGVIQTMVNDIFARERRSPPKIPLSISLTSNTFVNVGVDPWAPCRSFVSILINPSLTPPVFLARKCAGHSGHHVEIKGVIGHNLPYNALPSRSVVCGEVTRPTWVLESTCNGTHISTQKKLTHVPIRCSFL